jgi:hypothetical protein
MRELDYKFKKQDCLQRNIDKTGENMTAQDLKNRFQNIGQKEQEVWEDLRNDGRIQLFNIRNTSQLA